MKERGKKKRKKKREKKKRRKTSKSSTIPSPPLFFRSFVRDEKNSESFEFGSSRPHKTKRNETLYFVRTRREAEGGGRQGCTISQRAEWTRHLTCQDRRARGEYKRRWEERKEGGKEEQLIIARVKVGVASYICISHRCLLIRLASR